MFTDTFSTKRAAVLAGVSYRQADYWARTGLLRPLVEANGSGSRRRYTRLQVQQMRVAGLLARAGARSETIRAALDATAGLDPDLWAGHLVIEADGTAHLGGAPRTVAQVVNLASCALDAPEPARTPVAV